MSTFIGKERRVSDKVGTGIQYIPGHLEPFTDLILEKYLPVTGEIVDLGGGGLRFAVPAAAKGRSITVVDADPGSLDLCAIAKRIEENRGSTIPIQEIGSRIRPVVRDVFEFLKGCRLSFQLITSFRLIHFLSPIEMDSFFHLAADRLTPDGVFAFSGMTALDLDSGASNEIFKHSRPVLPEAPLYRQFDSSAESMRIQREQNLSNRFHLIDDELIEGLARKQSLEVRAGSFRSTRIVQGYVLKKGRPFTGT